jgi:SecD/SecF fusion protein
MEKQKRWHIYLIFAVLGLTLYNILPTLFYYSQPLKKPISEKEAQKVASEIVYRVNSLEEFTMDWLKAQSKNLGLKPTSIALDKENPKIAYVSFKKAEDAAFFAKTLGRAGSLIPFVPAELTPDHRSFEEGTTTVTVQRRIGVHLDSDLSQYFHFIPKKNADGTLNKEWRKLVSDRIENLALGLGGTTSEAKILLSLEEGEHNEELLHLARSIVQYNDAFGEKSAITQRYFAGFTQVSTGDKEKLVHLLSSRLDDLSNEYSKKIEKWKEKPDAYDEQKLKVLEDQKNTVAQAAAIVKKNSALFADGSTPLDAAALKTEFSKTQNGKTLSIEIGELNPFVSKLHIDLNKDTVDLVLHSDVNQIRALKAKSEKDAYKVDQLNQLLYGEIATLARVADETITPSLTSFAIDLNKLSSSSSLLTFDLAGIAKTQIRTIKQLLNASWDSSGDLSRSNFPFYDADAFKKLPAEQKNFSLVFYAPLLSEQPEKGFRNSSLYVIAKGAATIAQKYGDLPDSPEKEKFEKDFKQLVDTLRQNGFIGYQGAGSELGSAYKNDYIFELDDFASYLIAATRENFTLKGSKRYATLEFTDVEQRLLTLNKIETQEQEDLVKWKDEYQSAQVNTTPGAKYDVPPPTQNILFSNLWLSTKKYFRGDERKILRWGLDLSGGKTVRVGLKDKNNQTITN